MAPIPGRFKARGGYMDVSYDEIEDMLLSGAITVTGTTLVDNLVITATGANSGSYVLTSNGVPGPIVAFTGLTSFTFNGGDGNDKLTIAHGASTTLFAPSGGIVLNGGGQSGAPGDRLEVTGSMITLTAMTSTHTTTDANGNNGTLALDTLSITYTGLEPILVDVGGIGTVAFNLPAGANAVLTDDLTAGNNISSVNSNIMFPAAGSFEDTSFTNPSTKLTINAGAGADTIAVAGLDSMFDADLEINSSLGAGTVAVSFTTGATDIDAGGGGQTATIGTIAKPVTSISFAGGSLDAGTGASAIVNLNATGAISTTGPATDIFAGTLNAASSGGSIDIDTAVDNITASVLVSNSIRFDEADGVTLTSITTNNGNIDIFAAATAAGDLTVTSVVAGGSGDVTLNTTTSGSNVILTGTTTAAADDVTINSVGSINGAGLVTAATIDLNAATGIGNSIGFGISRLDDHGGQQHVWQYQHRQRLGRCGRGDDTDDGRRRDGLVRELGAGGVSFGTVSTTTDGSPLAGEDNITLSSDGGNLTITTSVTAGGVGDIVFNTTTSGNVILTGTTTADADDVTINSVGSINGVGLVTAATIDLNAATGIGNTTALELAGSTITADSSTSGNINIDNALAGAVVVTTLTTAGGGTILFENFGAGGVSFGTVSTTTEGSPLAGEDNITLSSDGGNLTITTSVTAGGVGDIVFNTTTSGNVILTGTTTAAADDVTINSVGSINGAGLVTAATIDLNAATGIGNTTALELAGSTITADSSTSGNIIDNALAGAVVVTTLTTAGGGTVLFENFGAGGVSFGTVSTTTDGSPLAGEDNITLSSDGGNLTITTSVTAGGVGDIVFNTTTSGNVILTGTTTADVWMM